jgi:putative hydrolase of the HAD superfamily
MIEVIAFDADDTLWHSESLYVMTQEGFKEVLAPYELNGDIDAKLYETEMGNLKTFGYGAKGFTLSMIETAIELTDGRIQGRDIQKIINAVREMISRYIKLLDGVAETIPLLARDYTLMMITKGDLLDQESKIARSGLDEYFQIIEVVSTKNKDVYQKLLDRNGIDIARFLMVGNSVPSDILPVLALGAPGVHIPYQYTWSHEHVELDQDPQGLYRLQNIGQLPELLNQIN